MARYKVVVARVEYQRTEVEVEAANKEEVEQLALEEASDFEIVNAEESITEITQLADDQEPKQICSYGPVQELYAAAKTMVATLEAGGWRDNALLQLQLVVANLEKMAKESNALTEVREWARDYYIGSSCDIAIDDHNLTHHNGSDGYWVGAWLWVPDDFREERIAENGQKDNSDSR